MNIAPKRTLIHCTCAGCRTTLDVTVSHDYCRTSQVNRAIRARGWSLGRDERTWCGQCTQKQKGGPT